MKSFVNIFKGIAVGLANVVAGLSGGTVAVILRAYDAMLDICTNIFKHPIVTLKEALDVSFWYNYRYYWWRYCFREAI